MGRKIRSTVFKSSRSCACFWKCRTEPRSRGAKELPLDLYSYTILQDGASEIQRNKGNTSHNTVAGSRSSSSRSTIDLSNNVGLLGTKHISLDERVGSADGESSDLIVGGLACVLVMNSVTNVAVFGLQNILNFAFAVRDVIR